MFHRLHWELPILAWAGSVTVHWRLYMRCGPMTSIALDSTHEQFTRFSSSRVAHDADPGRVELSRQPPSGRSVTIQLQLAAGGLHSTG